MNAFEVYCAYISLTRHFKTDSYDYFKYNGKVNVTVAAFEKRNDKYHFQKLAKIKDPESFILANLIDGDSDYIIDIVSKKGKDFYLSWLKRQEAMSYIFKSDLHHIQGSFVDSVKVKDSQHPALLKMYQKGVVCIETLIILDRVAGIFEYWNSKIADPIVWPDIYFKCSKYSQFLEIDTKRMRSILMSAFEDRD